MGEKSDSEKQNTQLFQIDMADRKQCDGNCMGCTMFQRQYCASQIAYNNMGLLSELRDKMDDLKKKIESIQNNEASLINPIEEE